MRLVEQIMGQIEGVNLSTAVDPFIGLDKVRHEEFDLVLVDINMPGMSGFEFLQAMREKQGARHIPAIAISANAMDKDIEKGKAAGFDEYLTKPLDVALFIQAVKRLLPEDRK